jgi:hypothetical protein
LRRITIFTDEDTAKELVPLLEEKGVDFMSEDYAEPTVTRRSTPTRRAPPDRHEASPGFLRPMKPPATPRERPPLSSFLLGVLKEAGTLDRDSLYEVAKDRGWKQKQVRDTLRRLVKSQKLLGMGTGGVVSRYALPAE